MCFMGFSVSTAHKPILRDHLLFPAEFYESVAGNETIRQKILTEERIEVRRHFKELSSAASSALLTVGLIGIMHIFVGLLMITCRTAFHLRSDWIEMKKQNIKSK